MKFGLSLTNPTIVPENDSWLGSVQQEQEDFLEEVLLQRALES